MMIFMEIQKLMPLVSRQAMFPCSTRPWVGAVRRFLRHCQMVGASVVSSYGTSGYDLTTSLSAALGLRLLIVCPEDATRVQKDRLHLMLLKNYRLQPGRYNLYFPDSESIKHFGARIARDRLALQLADRVFPLSLRKGGSLEKQLRFRDARDTDNRFRISPSKDSPRGYKPTAPDFQPVSFRDESDYLVSA